MSVAHHRTCHICEANCGIIVMAEGRDILSIKGDPDNALSRGHICPKATALEDLQNDPDRLRTPLKRDGESWEEIGWEQAFAEIGERTRTLLARDEKSTAMYIGNPNAHSFGNVLTTGDLKRAIRTRTVFSASTVDQMPHQVVNLRLYGHSGLWSVPDIDRTQTMIILGGNPMASNGSVWTVPDFRNRVKALQARGGELIVIDPRRSETAKIADRHLFIRPSTDAFFLVALLKTVIARSCAASYAHNLEAVVTALAPFDIEACAARAGVSMSDIGHIAKRMTSDRAALYGRIGVATQGFGTLNAWLIALINIVTGNLDRAGGLVFPTPAVDTVDVLSPGTIGRRHSRVSGHREVLGEFPAAAIAEEIETSGEGQIRALFVVAGNPVLSTPNGARLGKALASLDLMVSVDMYRNATSRLAHYILPPVGPLERDHYGLFLLPIAVRNFAKYSKPLFDPPSGALQDWEILRGLAVAIGGEPVTGPTPRQTLDGLLQRGPYAITLEELESHPSGMDFGTPEAGRLPERLRTPDKTIDCAPEEFVADLMRLAGELAEPLLDKRLRLIGRRHLRSNNTWLHNAPRLVKGKDRCTLLIHPEDARARNLGDGATAEVSSKNGMIALKVEVTDDMMPGTVSIPHGWGHNLPGVAMATAQAHAGVSINDLTDESALDPLSGNAALSGMLVEVRPAA
jgi:anaerobic selenocysteine-containing dehydrogenase